MSIHPVFNNNQTTKDEHFINVPEQTEMVELWPDRPRYLRTNRVARGTSRQSELVVRTDQRNVIGMQVPTESFRGGGPWTPTIWE